VGSIWPIHPSTRTIKRVSIIYPRTCKIVIIIIIIIIIITLGDILLINVYMPTDYNDDLSYDKYIDICTKIMVLFTDTGVSYLIVAGDFNCKVDSRFLACLLT